MERGSVFDNRSEMHAATAAVEPAKNAFQITATDDTSEFAVQHRPSRFPLERWLSGLGIEAR